MPRRLRRPFFDRSVHVVAPELIGATLLLASDVAGAFITGAELVVDGGFASMTI